MSINFAKSYLHQDGTLYTKGAAGTDGEPTYSTGIAVKTRVAALNDFIRAQLANTSRATAQAYFDPATTVAEGDRLVVGSTTYTVVSVDEARDLDGRVVMLKAKLATK